MKHTINAIVAAFGLLFGSAQTYGMELTKTTPTHSVAIIEDTSVIDKKETNIIFDLNGLKAKVGKDGLTTIHDTLLKQYAISQKEDAFTDFEKTTFLLFFNIIDKDNKRELSAIVCDRQSIADRKSLSSPLENLQYCLIKSANSTSNDNTPHFVVVGTCLGILLLLFIAHKFNLLPTSLPSYFKNVMP